MTIADESRAGAKGTALLKHALATRDPALLDAAVEHLRQAAAATPPDAPEAVSWRANLGAALQTRFQRAGDPADLDEAIVVHREVVAGSDPRDPVLVSRLGNLGVALHDRFDVNGTDADLDEAIIVLTRAVTAGSEQQLVTQSANLGIALQDRFEQRGDPADLDATVAALRAAADAAEAIGAGPAATASSRANLAGALLARFELRGDRADLDEGVSAARAAVAGVGPEHPKRALYLSSLGALCRARYTVTGTIDDLQDAITAFVEAEERSRGGTGPARALCLTALGGGLRDRYRRLGNPADLDSTVDAHRDAVETTLAGSRDLPGRLSNLAIALAERADADPDRAEDLDEAITIHENAVAAARDDDPAYASMLVNHGGALLGRFDRDGALADVTAAVDCYRRSIDIVTGHLRPVALAQLGQALRARHGATGSIDDLHGAVAALRDAVTAVPDYDLERPWYCSFLGSALCARFRWHGELTDIEESLRWHDRARKLLLSGRPGRARLLSSRAFALRVQAERAGVDVAKAVDAAQEALDAETDAARVPSLLAELGATLALRTDRVEDLTATIDVRRRVCELCPPDAPRRGLWLSDLASSLRTRAQRTGAAADLDEAHALHEESVQLTASGHPEYATVLSNLAGSFRDRYVRDGDRTDLHAAFDRLRQVAELTTAPVTRRLVAARTWGNLAADTTEWVAARDGFTTAVDLLPTATWRGLSRTSQEDLLRSSRWLATDAAAVALHLDDPAGALDLLERGRTVRWSQQLESVRTIDRLAEVAPDLATRLDTARAILDAPTAEPHAGSADSRIAAAQEWEAALADVESRADLAALLTGPSSGAPELPGTLITLTVSRYRCAAILTDRDGTHQRELPAFDLGTLADQVQAYFGALAVIVDPDVPPEARRNADTALTEVLHWLWEALLADALDGVASGERVWWCPTGPLTYLPLHAAGDVPDLVISSYTPTLGALLRALRPTTPTRDQVLAVAVPAAVGQPPLPGALREVTALADQLPPGTDLTTLTGPTAGCDAVSTALRSCTWAHLACHGEQNPADPAQAALVLADGRLQVTDITTRAVHHAEGAYLSACHTALGGVELSDEVLHLAAALQFGGFRRVIATLWPVGDTTAQAVARQIYAALTTGERFDPGQSAVAVRDVTLRLRARHPDSPMVWAPFVHIGP